MLPRGGNLPCQSVEKMWAEKKMILVSRQLSMEWVKESSELIYSVTRLQRASSSKLYYNTADADPTRDLLIF